MATPPNIEEDLLVRLAQENNAQMMQSIPGQLAVLQFLEIHIATRERDRIAVQAADQSYNDGIAFINESAIRRDNAQNTGNQQVLLTHFREANQELMDLMISTQQRIRTAQQAVAAQRIVV